MVHTSLIIILTRITKSRIAKKYLKILFRKPVEGFSYPNGIYSSYIESLFKSAGYKFACTSECHQSLKEPTFIDFRVFVFLIIPEINFLSG